MKKLDQLNFQNTFARLPDTFHSRLHPTPLPEPYLVSFNANAAELIDLDPDEAISADFAEYFIGNRLLPGSDPLEIPLPKPGHWQNLQLTLDLRSRTFSGVTAKLSASTPKMRY